jgi:nucleoside-diphosphate-sugar epimerase
MYGSSDRPLDEDTPLLPATPFGRHKHELESMVAGSGARWLTVRLSHAVGRGQRAHQFFPGMVGLVRSGSIRIFRDGCRDLLDVEDAVRAVDALLERGVDGEVVNVASGTPYPVESVVRGIEKELGVVADKQLVDAEPRRTRVSVDKLRRLLPGHHWPPRGDEYLERIIGRYAPHY